MPRSTTQQARKDSHSAGRAGLTLVNRRSQSPQTTPLSRPDVSPKAFPYRRGRGWGRWVERGLPILVDAACRAAFRIEAYGLENLRRTASTPSTLIVANHRRDTDALLIAGLLLNRRGLSVRGELPYFVAREDLFHRGFLFNYLENWPLPLRELLGCINVGPILSAVHAQPMRRVPERTLGEVLESVRDKLGNQPLDQVLRPTVLAAFRELAGTESRRMWIDDVLCSHFQTILQQKYGLRRLTRSCFRAILPRERSVIHEQLQGFVSLLEDGYTLLLEPEGLVSVTGEFLRIRRGIHVLLKESRAPVRVLPVGIAYDFMSTGRRQVFIRIGSEIRGLQAASRREVSQRVTEAILRQTTVTTSGLASRAIMNARRGGADFISTAYLLETVRAAARRCAAAGAQVDIGLLDDAGSAVRVRSFLHYCRRAEILEQVAANRWRLNRCCSEAAACFADPAGLLAYACNELRSQRRIHPDLAYTAGG